MPNPQALGCQDAPVPGCSGAVPGSPAQEACQHYLLKKRVEKRRGGSGADAQRVENQLTCPRSRIRSRMGQMTSIQLSRSNKALFFHIFGLCTREHVVISCFFKRNMQEIVFEGSGMYGIFTKFTSPFCFSSVFCFFFSTLFLLIYCFIILFLK